MVLILHGYRFCLQLCHSSWEKNSHWLWNLCHVKKQALSHWVKPMFTSVSVQNCLHIIILSRCCSESVSHISSLLWTVMTVRMDETANPGLLQNDFRVLFILLAFLESCWVQHLSYMHWLTFTEMISGVTCLWLKMFLKPVSSVILVKPSFLSSVLYLAFVSAPCSPVLRRADDQ